MKLGVYTNSNNMNLMVCSFNLFWAFEYIEFDGDAYFFCAAPKLFLFRKSDLKIKIVSLK